MQAVLHGDLRHFPVAELLTFLCSRGQSGTLELEDGDRRARILYQDDKILYADGSRRGDTLETALDAFTWTEGSFRLLDSAYVPENVAPAVLDLTGVLEESRRRAEAASSFPDGTFFRVVDDPALQQQVSLTADQFKLLFRVASGRSFRDLVAELNVAREELAKKLKDLREIGLVVIVEEQPPMPDLTIVQRRTLSRRRTMVGSLTPDGAPDSVFPLLDSECTIGRAGGNSVQLSDGSVSSHHARVLRSPEGFVLEDLQSRNGTFVNGERVAGKRILTDGDLVRLGKVIMTFNIAREARGVDQTQPEVRVGDATRFS